jgi:sugar phosphate isomerase/epimerase
VKQQGQIGISGDSAMQMTRILAIGLIGLAATAAFGAEKAPFPFFAYCIDTHDSKHRTLPEQAAMLKELGFDGVGHLWLDNVKERLETLDAAGLKLFQITIRVNIAPGKEAYEPRIKEILPLLKGRDVQICPLIESMPPSDVKGDERGVAIIRELADMARDSGTKIVLYPHVNMWLEKVSDAVRLAKKAERANVGVMFNLCHWMKLDKEANLRPVLESALPYLLAVSINGTDHADAIRAGTGNWLQPLDKGDYDVLVVLKTLKELGYKGPVGLQCWGIEGDAKDHLAGSMAAWKKYVERLAN